MTHGVADAVALCLSGLVLVHGVAWTALCLVAVPRPRSPSGELSAAIRLAAVVPAHNERASIERCVSSLKASGEAAGIHLPIIVVADNCTDDTASIARSAGAIVVERRDPGRRGKPYALEFGLAWLRDHGPPGAVIFIDGDSTVNRDFVRVIGGRLTQGALAVQGHYSTGDGATPLHRLRRIALMLVHWSRPLGAARMGLGTGLKGNGMALRWNLVANGFGAAGLAEDAELTLALCRQGVAVVFEPGAMVVGDMAGSYDSARNQDRRWEGGRLALAPAALSTSARALAHGNVACAAVASEVASLPLSLLVLSGGAALVLAASGFGALALALAAAGSLVTYVAAGLVAARASLRDVMTLVWAPRFILHKALVFVGLVLRGSPSDWQKTPRP